MVTRVEGQFGIDVVLWFQGWRAPWFATSLLPLHWMGASVFYVALLSALYWCVDARLGRRLILVFLATAWANGWLKALFDLPRPPEVSSLVEPFVAASGPGMPSGHAMTATVLWGLIALGLRRRFVTYPAVLIVVFTGLSRVVHGVHFPSDVVVGWVLGAAVVAMVAVFGDRVEAFLSRRNVSARVGLAVAVAVCMLAVCPGLTPIGERSTYLPSVTSTGAFAGAALGMSVERARVGFAVARRGRLQAWSYVVGVASMAVVFGGLTLAAHRAALAPGWVDGVARFVRFALVGGWLTVGAPWLLVRVGLLEREASPQLPS